MRHSLDTTLKRNTLIIPNRTGCLKHIHLLRVIAASYPYEHAYSMHKYVHMQMQTHMNAHQHGPRTNLRVYTYVHLRDQQSVVLTADL